MSEDLDKKIQQIAQLLGQESVPDNLKELVALFASSLGTRKEDAANPNPSGGEFGEKSGDADHTGHTPALDPEILNKARKALETLNSGRMGEQQTGSATSPGRMGEQQTRSATSPGRMGEQQTGSATSPGSMGEQQTRSVTSTGSDPRINLLQAIKPFMNSKRQKKIGSCIQLLQVASLSRILNDHENR